MSDEAVLELLAPGEGEKRTTPEIAAELGISKPATWKRLSDLYERGLLEKQPSSGLRSEAWSLSESGRAVLADEATLEES